MPPRDTSGAEGAALRQRVIAGAARLGVTIDPAAVRDLIAYLEILRAWNERLNLVGEHDAATIVNRHLVDSLAAVPLLRELSRDARIADLGSGAGLPGIPLAAVLRPAEMVLVEPRRKRASFLREVQRRLPHLGLRVAERRAEELAADVAAGAARRFAAIVTRAALPDAALLPLGVSLLQERGLLIAYRGVEGAGPGIDLAPPTGLEPLPSLSYRLDARHMPFSLRVWRRSRFT